MATIEQLNGIVKSMFPGLMGMEIVEAGPDQIVGKLMVRPDLCTVGGTLHGGAYMTFADTLGAIATVVNIDPKARTTTLESKTNFLGSAPAGTVVTGTSTPLHKGRSTQVWTTRITGSDGRLLAVVTQTQMIIPPKA
jgi:uncharacterized protein (TIGR00369 family)